MEKNRLLKMLEFGYLLYAVFVAFVAYFLYGKVMAVIGKKEPLEFSLADFLPLMVLGLIVLIYIALPLVVVYFLHLRIHRVACLGLTIVLALFPPGILLLIFAIMLLTHKEIRGQFTS
jgi:hypothetical protein